VKKVSCNFVNIVNQNRKDAVWFK